MDIRERIEHIREKAMLKGIKLKPVISRSELEALESKYGIILPEEYRSFLLAAGNGGDGPPYYGLLDLQAAVIKTDIFNKQNTIMLDKPFPLTDPWVWEGEKLTPERLERQREIYRGFLVLGDEGCGMYWVLIVTGEERGRVWCFADVGVQSCAPALSFLDWYEYWLDGGRDWWRLSV
jgi:hypothetical protein